MTKMISPAPAGWSEYGWNNPVGHKGRDYGWYNADITGSRRIVTAARGTVVLVEANAGYNAGWGNRIWVQHAPGFVTAYNHFMTGALNGFSVGQVLEAGHYLGQMGNTGDTGGTTHLHFEVWINGTRVDPDTYFVRDIPGTETPVAGPTQRIVGPKGVVGRDAPNTQTTVIMQDFTSGEVLDFKGFVYGEDVWGDKNRVWFVGAYAGNYFHSSRFTDTSTHDLPDLTPTTPVPPVDPPVKAPSITQAELPSVTEIRALGSTNYEIGNFPDQPMKVIIHQFGTPNVDTYNSVMNTITKDRPAGKEVGCHFVVDDLHTTQTGSLKNRTYHAGIGGNNYIGIESDPNQGERTVARVNKLLDELERYYGYRLEVTDHRSIPGSATSCGSYINLDNYRKIVDPPDPEPEPGNPMPAWYTEFFENLWEMLDSKK